MKVRTPLGPSQRGVQQQPKICKDSENTSYFEVMKASSEDSYKSKCYTVEEAINNIGFGPFQVLVSCFAGMIWVSFFGAHHMSFHAHAALFFLQTTDAMEIMLLSILSPIVKCEWHLKDWEEVMITAVSDIFLMWLGNEASHERVQPCYKCDTALLSS